MSDYYCMSCAKSNALKHGLDYYCNDCGKIYKLFNNEEKQMTDQIPVPTPAAPSTPIEILNDIEQAVLLFQQFKADLSVLHPTVFNMVALMLKGL